MRFVYCQLSSKLTKLNVELCLLLFASVFKWSQSTYPALCFSHFIQVTIWKWNLLLCLVNPSCPNVILPPIKKKPAKNRSDYYPSSPANLEMLRALNQYVNFPNWY